MFAVDPIPPSQTKFDLPPPVDEGSAPIRGVRYEPSTLRLWYYTASLGQDQPGEEELVTTTKRQRGSLPIRHYRIPSSATSPHLESIDYTLDRYIYLLDGERAQGLPNTVSIARLGGRAGTGPLRATTTNSDCRLKRWGPHKQPENWLLVLPVSREQPSLLIPLD
jgi:hypothetical protein